MPAPVVGAGETGAADLPPLQNMNGVQKTVVVVQLQGGFATKVASFLGNRCPIKKHRWHACSGLIASLLACASRSVLVQMVLSSGEEQWLGIWPRG
jgi:hypothetical protein